MGPSAIMIAEIVSNGMLSLPSALAGSFVNYLDLWLQGF